MASVVLPSADLEQLVAAIAERHKLKQEEAVKQVLALTLNSFSEQFKDSKLQESLRKVADVICSADPLTTSRDTLMSELADKAAEQVNKEARREWSTTPTCGLKCACIASHEAATLPVAFSDNEGMLVHATRYLWLGDAKCVDGKLRITAVVQRGAISPQQILHHVANGNSSMEGNEMLTAMLRHSESRRWCVVAVRAQNASEQRILELLRQLFNFDKSPVKCEVPQRTAVLSIALDNVVSGRFPEISHKDDAAIDLDSLSGVRTFSQQLISIATELFAISELCLSPSQVPLRRRMRVLELQLVELQLADAQSKLTKQLECKDKVEAALQEVQQELQALKLDDDGRLARFEADAERLALKRDLALVRMEISTAKAAVARLQSEKDEYSQLLTRR